ncbi:MAG: hypothetical protein KA243_00405 [Candidatus Aminicenantes bacterium]|nr:hypothetical protein [Candidatus Aminicenantes bacterium]
MRWLIEGRLPQAGEFGILRFLGPKRGYGKDQLTSCVFGVKKAQSHFGYQAGSEKNFGNH